MSTNHDRKFCVLCLSGGHTVEPAEAPPLSTPLTGESLAEVRARAARAACAPDHPGSYFSMKDSAEDVPALLAEVRRQAELLDRVGAQLARWRHIHNRAEAAAELRAELDREVTE